MVLHIWYIYLFRIGAVICGGYIVQFLTELWTNNLFLMGDKNVMSHRFRDTVLASGGARHPRDVFQDFRGRPLSSDALLKSYGLHWWKQILLHVA